MRLKKNTTHQPLNRLPTTNGKPHMIILSPQKAFQKHTVTRFIWTLTKSKFTGSEGGLRYLLRKHSGEDGDLLEVVSKLYSRKLIKQHSGPGKRH